MNAGLIKGNSADVYAIVRESFLQIRLEQDDILSCEGAMKTTLKQHQVTTQRPYRDGSTPRMPHERDESNDNYDGNVRDDMKQAYEDLQNGQVDTDLRETGGVDEVVNDRPGKSPDKVIKKSF